jgi:uncharacterized protein (DUF486 family)
MAGTVKIIQEVVTLSVFIPSAILYMGTPFNLIISGRPLHGRGGVFHLSLIT